MKFNKLSAAIILSTFMISSSYASNQNEIKAYKGKKIESKNMDMLNNVLVKFPSTALRMAMAAERGQGVVDSIDKLEVLSISENGMPVYFDTPANEREFVKKQLKFVLEPVEKFMEDIKEQRSIVKKLLEDSLGIERMKNSFIYIALDVEGSFLAFFSETIKTVSELYTAASEFLMFFADVNASMNPAAKEAKEKLIEKLKSKAKSAGK